MYAGTEALIRKARGDRRDALGYAGAGLMTGVAVTLPIGECRVKSSDRSSVSQSLRLSLTRLGKRKEAIAIGWGGEGGGDDDVLACFLRRAGNIALCGRQPTAKEQIFLHHRKLLGGCSCSSLVVAIGVVLRGVFFRDDLPGSWPTPGLIASPLLHEEPLLLYGHMHPVLLKDHRRRVFFLSQTHAPTTAAIV